MPRQLILVPDPAWLRGPAPIGQGYTKANTPAEMRQLAAGLDAHYQRQERRYGPPPTPAETRAANTLLLDPRNGDRIRGDLGSDGRVELENGQHRAYYIAERGTPVPVWVSHPDQRELDRFAKQCDDRLIRDRPQLHARPDDAREFLPDVDVPIQQRPEPTRERGPLRDER